MRIYLDHNATTPLRPEVVDAMARALRDLWGNPSSVYVEGAAARAAVERAREQVAELAGARPEEVVFTAGASEANNAALSGVRRHLVTTSAEHPSVLEPAAALEARGVRVTRLAVDADGLVDPDALRAALGSDTDLVSILWANNETGVLQPMAELAEIARAAGVPLHVDATQALGKLPLDVPADFVSASAHKLNGPKGTGCLICRRDPPVLIRGGPQERRRRGGTENVAGIVGFGEACRLARAELAARAAAAAALRDRLWEALRAIPGIRRNGAPGRVLPNTLSVSISGVEGDLLVQALDLEGVAVSAGAACHSGSVSPSHVLLAMGRSSDEARATLRFSVGHGNDAAQIDAAAERVRALVARVREGRAA